MMKERFAKLLLGEDMSGSGKGVCTALAISNAITNLCGTLLPSLLLYILRISVWVCVRERGCVVVLLKIVWHFL